MYFLLPSLLCPLDRLSPMLISPLPPPSSSSTLPLVVVYLLLLPLSFLPPTPIFSLLTHTHSLSPFDLLETLLYLSWSHPYSVCPYHKTFFLTTDRKFSCKTYWHSAPFDLLSAVSFILEAFNHIQLCFSTLPKRTLLNLHIASFFSHPVKFSFFAFIRIIHLYHCFCFVFSLKYFRKMFSFLSFVFCVDCSLSYVLNTYDTPVYVLYAYIFAHI